MKISIGYEFDAPVVSGNYADGGFTLTLPNTVSNRFCRNIEDEYNYDGNVNVHISNKNANIAVVNDYFYCYDKDDENFGAFVYYKEESNRITGAFFIYADRDVTVTGSDDYCNYNMSLKNGWNIAYHIAPESGKEELTTEEVGGLKWGVTGYSIPGFDYELDFDVIGGTRELEVKTLVSDWTVEKYSSGDPSDWFSVARNGNKIVVTVDPFENGDRRTGQFFIVNVHVKFPSFHDVPLSIYNINQRQLW